MTRVFNRERTWLDPLLRPVERLVYRLTGVDETQEMRWTEYAGALLAFSAVSMLALYVLQRLQGVLPLNPQAFARRRAGSGLQHRGVLYDQHELAVVRRRDHDELSDADGRARVPQLHLGRGRHRSGHRVRPRHCAAGDSRPSATSGWT